VFRGIVEDNPMLRVREKFSSCLHRFKDARFAFNTKVTGNIRLSSNIANKRFRAMNVEIVNHNMPSFDVRVCLNQLANVFHVILFGTGGTSSHPDNPAESHIECKDKGQSAMPDILMLDEAIFARSRWLIGMFPFQGLNACLFIVGNDKFPIFRQFWSTLIEFIDGFTLAYKLFIFDRIEPVTTLMGAN
jgi:hypothetical protein